MFQLRVLRHKLVCHMRFLSINDFSWRLYKCFNVIDIISTIIYNCISTEKFLKLTHDSKSIHSRYHSHRHDTNFPILSTLRNLSCIYYSLAHLSCIYQCHLETCIVFQSVLKNNFIEMIKIVIKIKMLNKHLVNSPE